MIVGIQGIYIKKNMLNVVRLGKVYIHLGVGFGIWDARISFWGKVSGFPSPVLCRFEMVNLGVRMLEHLQ